MNKETLINDIRNTNWEFAEDDTQYLTHNIHRYSGKFIPQIAGKAIDILTVPGETVLDSYMGSGTTLLESLLRGRNALGVDLNPLACLISRVKTTPLSSADLNELNKSLIPYVQMLALGGQTILFEQSFDETAITEYYQANMWRLTDDWNKKWYQEDVLHQLVQIYSAVETVNNPQVRDVALVAFSDILRKSSNASSKYPNVMYDKNVKKKPLPAKAFLDSLSHVVNAIIQLSEELKGNNNYAKIYQQSNLSLPMEAESVDAIISHPPYIAAIPYAEYGSLSLTWLGVNCKELDESLTGGRRHSSKVVDRFFEDYKHYFEESYRVLKTGKYMFLMVGNPVSHGELVDLNQYTVDLAESAGFSHIETALREGQNRRGNKMGQEYLLFFQK